MKPIKGAWLLLCLVFATGVVHAQGVGAEDFCPALDVERNAEVTRKVDRRATVRCCLRMREAK